MYAEDFRSIALKIHCVFNYFGKTLLLQSSLIWEKWKFFLFDFFWGGKALKIQNSGGNVFQRKCADPQKPARVLDNRSLRTCEKYFLMIYLGCWYFWIFVFRLTTKIAEIQDWSRANGPFARKIAFEWVLLFTSLSLQFIFLYPATVFDSASMSNVKLLLSIMFCAFLTPLCFVPKNKYIILLPDFK